MQGCSGLINKPDLNVCTKKQYKVYLYHIYCALLLTTGEEEE